MKITKKRSVEGLSLLSCYADFISYIGFVATSMYNKLSFGIYGESVIINIQNAIIILLFWWYSGKTAFIGKAMFTSFSLMYSYLLFDGSLMTETYWSFVVSFGLLLSMFKFVSQIYKNFQMKSTGQLSFLTNALQFGGRIARTVTVFVESDNFMYNIQFLPSIFW